MEQICAFFQKGDLMAITRIPKEIQEQANEYNHEFHQKRLVGRMRYQAHFGGVFGTWIA